MPSSPFFSGRIPQKLLDAIENYRAVTGKSKTDVLVSALAQYVGFQLPEVEVKKVPIDEKFEEVFRRLDKHEERISKLESQPKKVETKHNQLNLL